MSGSNPHHDRDEAARGAAADAAASRRTRLSQARADVHLLDYVRILYKRRWSAGTVFLLVLLAAAVYTFTATPLYEARTRLLIETDAPNVVAFKEVIDQANAQSDYYQTQYNILQSRTLARDVLDDLRLWDDPLFGAPQTSPLSSLWTFATQLMPFSRDASRTATSIDQIGARRPYLTIPRDVSGFYARSLHRDHDGEWDFDLAWKPLESWPVYAGWLRAVPLRYKILR